VFQILESWALKMGVSKHRSRKGEESKKGDGICGQATKDIAREETSMSYIGKDMGAL